MADTERKFSELVNAGVFDGTEIMAMSQMNVGTLLSVKATLQAIANWFAVNSQYASALDTSNKTLCGAINELKQLISLIPQFSIEVVNTLPVSDISETTIYLVPNSDPEQGNYYEEYIYVNNAWELVGTTEVDLSEYYTKLEVDGLLSAKANSSDVTTALALKEDKSSMNTDVTTIVVGLTDEQTTAPGNPVTLTTEQSGGAKSALVTFSPKQSGTGDPSPENVRPFVLWDSTDVAVIGKNHFNKDGHDTQKRYIPSRYLAENGNVNTPATNPENWFISERIVIAPNTRYTLSGLSTTSSTSPSICFYDKNKVFISGEKYNNRAKFSLITPVNAVYCQISAGLGETYWNTIQLELGETATAYEPYKGETRTATFSAPIAGGSYDFASGEGSETWDYIASYAGETLPGEWMSDRDVYAEGTTPTTGAEVAYVTATPTPITLTPADVNLLKGSNTVWTDGDTVQVKYSELPNGNLGAVIDYIKKLEARVAALES